MWYSAESGSQTVTVGPVAGYVVAVVEKTRDRRRRAERKGKGDGGRTTRVGVSCVCRRRGGELLVVSSVWPRCFTDGSTRYNALIRGVEDERACRRAGGGRAGDGEGCRCAAGGRFRGLTRAAGAMSVLPSALKLTCCRSWLLLLICFVFLVSGCSCGARPDRLNRQLLLAGDDVRGSSYDDDDVDDADDYDDEQDYLEHNITAGECFTRGQGTMDIPDTIDSASATMADGCRVASTKHW